MNQLRLRQKAGILGGTDRRQSRTLDLGSLTPAPLGERDEGSVGGSRSAFACLQEEACRGPSHHSGNRLFRGKLFGGWLVNI